MDFTFTEDQLLFRDSVKTFFQTEVMAESIRASWETETGRNPECWQRIAELGLTGMLVPEAQGGLGMNELDFVLLAQEAGRCALPEPLVEMAMVAVPLLCSLAETDSRSRTLLEAIATGESCVAVGHPINDLVCDAHIADWLLLSSGEQIHLVPRSETSLVAQQSVDPSRRLFRVEWEPSQATCLVDGKEGVAMMAETLNRGALGVAAQLLGLAEAMIEQTVAYTSEREQFGKPIGVNQALKHHMANCAVESEFAKGPLYRAAYVVAMRPLNANYAVSHAKVATGSAALLAAKNSIQCHGAMGYTWECDLHIWMKKAWALDKFWGHAGFHKNRLHQWLLNPDAQLGADMTFGRVL